jgi:hypothetical protein
MALLSSYNATNQSNAATALGSATAYVNYINESGYLIFSPNLTTAYNYLNKSSGMISTDPANAIAYANAARYGALQQYEKINSYRAYSIIGMAAFTVLMAAILYLYMQPVRKYARRR